ncbi:MAG: carbohydrate-binding family 9-like protein [Cytophagales bacterium]|nr:carbohydrate-binding family 9-like protein [Cytophagales bacterium]
MKSAIVPIITFLIFIAACRQVADKSGKAEKAFYPVARLEHAPDINAVWNKLPWNRIKPIQIDQFMGDRPTHFPFTQAKLGYDDEAIYVIFRVEDQYVKAVHTDHQDPVYQDSCVEFFFTPESDIDAGYFNLEMNCGGTMLFHHQMKPGTDKVNINSDDIPMMTVAHSLPEVVDPEIEDKTTWMVEYRIPFSMLKKYHDFSAPETGAIWRANFYKCADKTSHPHWLTWAPVDFPRPNFHLPKYFGILEFQE